MKDFKINPDFHKDLIILFAKYRMDSYMALQEITSALSFTMASWIYLQKRNECNKVMDDETLAKTKIQFRTEIMEVVIKMLTNHAQKEGIISNKDVDEIYKILKKFESTET